PQAELDRVRDEVRDDLLEPRTVPDAREGAPGGRRQRGAAPRERRRRAGEDLAHDLAHVHVRKLEAKVVGARLRRVEELVDETLEAALGAPDGAQELALPRLEPRAGLAPWRSAGEAPDGEVERRHGTVQLVARDREELVAGGEGLTPSPAQ